MRQFRSAVEPAFCVLHTLQNSLAACESQPVTMKPFRDKSAQRSIVDKPQPVKCAVIDVTRYFVAGLKLDMEDMEFVVNSGEVDVNSVTTYGQSRPPGAPGNHTMQTFGSNQPGKVACQIFEKIDHEDKVSQILHMLQVIWM